MAERNGSEAHATRGRDGRQEVREGGYYHLHRYLDDSLLLLDGDVQVLIAIIQIVFRLEI
jgi:hypothetical protein